MKKSILAITLFALLGLSSCTKTDVKPDSEIDWDTLETCNWDPSEVADKSIWKEYILKPIVVSEDCNCIVSGYVKYLKNGKTAILINYGDGECNDWGVKVICHNGKCEGKNAKKCKFETNCDAK